MSRLCGFSGCAAYGKRQCVLCLNFFCQSHVGSWKHVCDKQERFFS
jgi:hypothetical protein